MNNFIKTNKLLITSGGELNINNKEINDIDIISGDTSDDNKKICSFLKLLDFIYPVGSYFFYYKYYKIDTTTHKPVDDSGSTIITNTILDYFEWELINDNSTNTSKPCNIGLMIHDPTIGYDDAQFDGDKNINLDHVPDHAHQTIYGFSVWDKSTGYYIPTEDSGWKSTRSISYSTLFTGNTVGYTNTTDKTFTPRSTQQPFIPYGYYLYVYKRISSN